MSLSVQEKKSYTFINNYFSFCLHAKDFPRRLLVSGSFLHRWSRRIKEGTATHLLSRSCSRHTVSGIKDSETKLNLCLLAPPRPGEHAVHSSVLLPAAREQVGQVGSSVCCGQVSASCWVLTAQMWWLAASLLSAANASGNKNRVYVFEDRAGSVFGVCTWNQNN